jgi:UDP-2,3-diacylglucosamine hydrolase
MMDIARPDRLVWPVVNAPSCWRTIDLMADLHLQDSDVATFTAWQHYMASTQADALFILGDLFEVWVGDDIALCDTHQPIGFEAKCQHILADASLRMSLFFMHGNRDFLLGQVAAQACGMTLLSDPTVLVFDQQRWLLSHGDALCLDDISYQQFRRQVRTETWCHEFLVKPLRERQAMGRSLRAQSTSHKSMNVDINILAAQHWLDVADAPTLIHGHTHHPYDRILSLADTKHQRYLALGDWNMSATPPRSDVLRLSTGATTKRLNADGVSK